jgi:hypothetical protein
VRYETFRPSRAPGTNRRIRRAVAVIAVPFMFWALSGGAQVVSAGVGVNLDQWATKPGEWQNGNLNGNNSAYPEGGVVPFRLAIEGLSAGSHSITISYDFTANGHKAYDFLATWNSSAVPGLCAAGGGAVSSMCPSLGPRAVRAFPSDPFVANGLRVSGAEASSRVTRNLTIYGGTITGISGPTHAGSVDAGSTATFRVSFTSRGSAVLMVWGGHLANSAYWDRSAGGPLDGAAEVSGAPWHMRTLQLDGSGNRNQDRSIQSSAVYRIAAPAPPTAAPTPNAPTGTNPPSGTGTNTAGGRNPSLTLPASSTAPVNGNGSTGGWLGSLLLALLAGSCTVAVAGRARRLRR